MRAAMALMVLAMLVGSAIVMVLLLLYLLGIF